MLTVMDICNFTDFSHCVCLVSLNQQLLGSVYYLIYSSDPKFFPCILVTKRNQGGNWLERIKENTEIILRSLELVERQRQFQ